MEALNHKKLIPREHKRRSASHKIKVTCHKLGTPITERNLSLVVLDLSEGGARLLVTLPLKVGEKVVLGLEGPALEAPLTRRATVVWSFQVTEGGYATGVRLEELLGGDDLRQVTI